jgi:hypothetical protein
MDPDAILKSKEYPICPAAPVTATRTGVLVISSGDYSSGIVRGKRVRDREINKRFLVTAQNWQKKSK